MRTANWLRSLLVPVFLITGVLPAWGLPNAGVGLFTDSPLVFASWVSTAVDTYEILAYRPEGEDQTRLVARRVTPIGELTTVDDVLLDGTALTLRWNDLTKLWYLDLDAELTSIGVIDIVLVTGQDPFSRSVGCGLFYNFISLTAGLSISRGNIYGSIGDQEVISWWCNAWGWNVSGQFMSPPVGTREY